MSIIKRVFRKEDLSRYQNKDSNSQAISTVADAAHLLLSKFSYIVLIKKKK